MDDINVNPDIFALIAQERIAAAAIRDAKLTAVIEEMTLELIGVRENLQKQIEANLLLKDVIIQYQGQVPDVEVQDASADR